MLSHRRDPYLWIHLAGLATVPLWLDICLVGLAVGEPVVPPWLELIALVATSTGPMVWMQLQKPFYIFSVPGLALRPDKLSPDRRRLLTIQRGWVSRSLVVLTAIALLWGLYTLYQLAPMATDFPGLAGKSRATGWGICAIAFLFANLFALVPATVVPLLLTSPQRLAKVSPCESSQILSKFMVVGLRLGKILPEPAPLAAEEAVAATSEGSPVPTDADDAASGAAIAATDSPADQSEPAASDEAASATPANVTPQPATSDPEPVAPTAEVANEELPPATSPSATATETAAPTSDTADAAIDDGIAPAEKLAAEVVAETDEAPSATDLSASKNGAGSLNVPSTDEI